MTNLEFLRLQHSIERRLLGVSQLIEEAELKEKDMAVSKEAADLIAKFDAATSAIASRIAKLVANANPPISADDQAAFQTEIDKLAALGQDPANPVPSV